MTSTPATLASVQIALGTNSTPEDDLVAGPFSVANHRASGGSQTTAGIQGWYFQTGAVTFDTNETVRINFRWISTSGSPTITNLSLGGNVDSMFLEATKVQ